MTKEFYQFQFSPWAEEDYVEVTITVKNISFFNLSRIDVYKCNGEKCRITINKTEGLLTLSETTALNKAILVQSATAFDIDSYNRAITRTYGEKTTEQMVKKYIQRYKSKRN